jgi:ABC-2 family transporter protein
MYARLWWKDARQFWPIWLVLIVAAAFTQWMLLSFVGRPVRLGGLGLAALIWASLYALAAGAGAFAGERETGTLKLLDHLAADRSVIWAGKVSFALVTTLALTLLFLVMAAVSTERLIPAFSEMPFDYLAVCMIVPVSLGWGLCWSSILKTSLGASLAALTCIGLTLIVSGRGLDEILSGDHSQGTRLLLTAAMVVIVTSATSAACFAGRVHLKRLDVQFRSPIVVTRTHSPAARRIIVQSPVAAIPAPSPPPRPMAVARIPEAEGAAPFSRRAWIIEARTLAFQTIKEASRMWLSLAAVAIALPAFGHFFYSSYRDSFWLVILAGVGFLAAGVSVFGLENRARTYRFLVHHGARPALVWTVKLATWICGLAAIALAAGCSWILMRISNGPSGEHWGLALSSPLLVFSIAVLSGMTCRRGITAFVLAMVLSLALMFPLLSLVFLNLVPESGVFLVTAALLAISWAWRTDWLLDRPAPGRWLRLGLFVSIAFALLSAGNIAYRVWSVPDVGPIAPPAAWNDASSIEPLPDENAAGLYENAGRQLVQNADSSLFLSRNREILGVIRRAAARPECQFKRATKPTLITSATTPLLAQLERLVSLEARAHLQQGDLAASWDDIIVLFRMARHFAEGSGIEPALSALKSVEREGLTLAIEWAMARGQTPERLHAALAAYRSLPKMPDASEIIRAEANILENTLDLRASTFRDWLTQSLLGEAQVQGAGQLYAFASANLIAAPWERARARRLNRLFSADLLAIATREPSQRPDQTAQWLLSRDLGNALRGTPRLMMNFFGSAGPYIDSDDHNQVGRRALELILALRAWQLKHDGQLPDDLGELVPAELPALPKDPYSGRSFGYARWKGQRVFPPDSVLEERQGSTRFLVDPPTPALWVLYSVGPDRRDDHGVAFANTNGIDGSDIGFLIPALDATAPAKKDVKAGGTAIWRLAPTTPS